MTLIEKRLSALERDVKILMSAREQIKEADRPDFGSNHVGKKSAQVLIQEGFSLKNSFKPETFSGNEHRKWNDAYESWKKDTLNFSDNDIKKINEEIRKMLHPEEK